VEQLTLIPDDPDAAALQCQGRHQAVSKSTRPGYHSTRSGLRFVTELK